MILKKILITLSLSILYSISYAQILDDSTKQIYSTKTVKYILEEDILNNRRTSYNPDTTLDDFHLFDFNLRSGLLYQDLGNIGTAIKPLFYTPSEQIGKQLGYATYGIYAFDVLKTTYFNTKSPYTNVNYVQTAGGTGRMHFTHAQNINPQLNFTLDVRRLSASKQYGAPRTREDRLIDSWAVMLHTNYESKNQKYIVLGSYNHFNHAPLDQGGIQPLTETDKFVSVENLRNYRDFLAKRTGATSRDWRNELHLYHQYKLSNGFQIYHILDYQNRRDLYKDVNFGTDSLASATYYQIKAPRRRDTLSVDLRYRLFENKFGIKGIYRGFAYRLYLRQRLYNLKSDFGVDFKLKLKSETLVGGWANYFFPDSVRRAYAEAEIGTNGNFRLQAEYISPKIKAGFIQLSNPANILDEYFVSAVYNWNRNLKNVFSNNFYASTNYQKGRFSITPSANYSIIKNYIYYDQKVQVAQTSTPISIFNAGLNTTFHFRKFLIDNQLYVIANSEKDLIRMPNVVNNTKITYDLLYAKVLRINMGVIIYYRSAYKADNYMPLTRQFYLQENQLAWGTPVADVFANLKVNKVRLFFKFAHANQGFPSKGYYASSTYPGLRRTFFLGVNWPLFD